MGNRASWRKFAATGVWLAWVVLLPTRGYAQQSSITGVVKDASGAVLPGVTVEAASGSTARELICDLRDAAGAGLNIDTITMPSSVSHPSARSKSCWGWSA